MADTNSRILFSRREAADALGVSVDTLARLVQSGELHHVRIGRSVLVPRAEILALIQRSQYDASSRVTERTEVITRDRVPARETTTDEQKS